MYWKDFEKRPVAESWQNDFNLWWKSHTWNNWYKTEKARDQAYRYEMLKLERYKTSKKNNIRPQLYIMGDVIEKIER